MGKFRDEKTTELILSSKGYKDADAIVIAELLKENKSVKIIHLYGNGIGDKGAVALASAVKVSTFRVPAIAMAP